VASGQSGFAVSQALMTGIGHKGRGRETGKADDLRRVPQKFPKSMSYARQKVATAKETAETPFYKGSAGSNVDSSKPSSSHNENNGNDDKRGDCQAEKECDLTLTDGERTRQSKKQGEKSRKGWKVSKVGGVRQSQLSID